MRCKTREENRRGITAVKREPFMDMRTHMRLLGHDATCAWYLMPAGQVAPFEKLNIKERGTNGEYEGLSTHCVRARRNVCVPSTITGCQKRKTDLARHVCCVYFGCKSQDN